MSSNCYLCGKAGTLDEIVYEGIKPFRVHELCKLRRTCFLQQDEIERLREVIRKSLVKTYGK